jgi:dolichol-phosphate mannosyltransferase
VKTLSLSIVVPFHNEALCAEPVMTEIRRAQPFAEIIAVNDGSTDETAAILDRFPGIRVIHLRRNLGQSAAVYAGMQAAGGDLIATLDGDGQNDPEDLTHMIRALESADFVIGYRDKRRDSAAKRFASRVANVVRAGILRDGARDTGCGIKVFKREVRAAFIPFNGLHRFMPALACNAGFRVRQVAVNHRPRNAGQSKYTNWERGLRGLYDLVGVSWYLRRAVHPSQCASTVYATDE